MCAVLPRICVGVRSFKGGGEKYGGISSLLYGFAEFLNERGVYYGRSKSGRSIGSVRGVNANYSIGRNDCEKGVVGLSTMYCAL